ncbi:zinc finger, CCHC-type containing protein [Tanacetum coccineum]
MELYRNLQIVLSVEDKLPFLEQPIPAMPVPPEGQVLHLDVLNTHIAWVKASKEIVGLMLMTMDPDIQKNLEHLGAYDMLKELKTLYAQQADQELLQTMREFHACKQEEGQSVSSYVLKMKIYIDNLEHLGHAMTQNLSVSLILVSLRKEYDGFVQNYSMHSMGKTVTGLHAMLKLHEQTLPPKEAAPALHAIRAGRIQKNQKKKSHKAAKGNQGKCKAKMGYAPVSAPPFALKPKNPPTPKNDNPAKDAIYHQCGKVGHWRRNCPVYLAESMKKKKLSQGASTSGIFTIELYSFPSTSWVYDTSCAVEAIGEFHLCLPSGLVLILHNCHYAPTITRGIISVSHLCKDAFVNPFENDNSISHCHLRHTSKKRIEKLQHDGLLDSTDIKSFEKCVSCMSGKMAKKPYSHQVERAKDLLGLIHTDVCGPFKIMSRQGASYFVTFTDDFSRYCYVYLLKHKHEVFENFKVFQKEVENQLGKTIKSLRSDRGGEYMSQEFLDRLKEHRIIPHRTPPYTPQHNGVSERRNRTLLDMGCEALVKRDTLTKPDKLEPRSIKCIFVGYPKETMRYSFYYTPENKVFVARNAEFLENSFIAQEAKDDQKIDEPQSDINPIRRSTRTRRPTYRLCLYVDAEEHELGDLGKPANYKAALLDPESDKWLNAMNVEMQSMRDN